MSALIFDRPRRFRLLALLALLAGSAVSCVDGLLVTPARAPARLVLAYSIVETGSAGGTVEAYDAVDQVRIQVVSETGVNLDVTRPFDPSSATTQVPIEIEVTNEEQLAAIVVELSRGADPLFRGGQAVTLRRGETQDVEMVLVPVPAGVRVPASVRTLTSIGDTVTLRGAVIFATGDTIPNIFPFWTSSNAAVADVSVLGLVTARGAGQTQVRAEFGGFNANVLVVVQITAGSVVGSVVDATNGRAIAGALVGLAIGPNAPAGAPLAVSTTTNANGAFALSASTGQYTLMARATGFLEGRIANVVLQGGQLSYQVALSPNISGAQTRIVLTWGTSPFDLDAHLTGPTSQGVPFHVYFANPGSLTASPFANLDRDDQDGLGPETITITQQLPGVYRFSVHDYTNQGNQGSTALGASGATVTVFQASGQVAQFRVPAGVGTLWTVFTLNGTSITPINTLAFQFPPGNAVIDPSRAKPESVVGR